MSNSGIAGNTTQQQTNATQARNVMKSAKFKLAFNIGIGLVLLVTAVILANAHLTFGWKMVVAVTMIYGSRLFTKVDDLSWARFIKTAGWILLIIFELTSNFGHAAIATVDGIEASYAAHAGHSSASSASDIPCPKGVSVPANGHLVTITVPPNCVATLDSTAIPVGSRMNILVDVQQEGKGMGKNPDDFAKVNFTVDQNNVTNGVRIKLDNDVDTTTFTAFLKK